MNDTDVGNGNMNMNREEECQGLSQNGLAHTPITTAAKDHESRNAPRLPNNELIEAPTPHHRHLRTKGAFAFTSQASAHHIHLFRTIWEIPRCW